MRITEENFKVAEKMAIERDLHISEAISALCSENGKIEILDVCKAMSLVRPRPENSHKGSFGKLVLIAGSDRFPGAAQISALSALRSGVGLCAVVTTRAAAAALAVSAKESTLLPLPSDERGFMKYENTLKDDIIETIKSADVLLIGPGLGQGAGCAEILKLAIKNADCPIILDADGINLVSTRIEFLRKAKAELVLTPHPAELSRLCGVPIGDVLGDRLRFAREISQKTGAVVAAKSAATLIVDGEEAFVSARGNSGLAKGGSGDFLAGIIGSFLAQGYSALDAVKIGVTVQGLACERVSERLSRRGMLASDLIDYLPELFENF